MPSPSSPSMLKEMALQQLLEIREKLLNPDSQASINSLPVEQQQAINRLISLAQINYLKIKKLSPEQVTLFSNMNNREPLADLDVLRKPVHDAASVQQFMQCASGFVEMLETCFNNPSSAQ